MSQPSAPQAPFKLANEPPSNRARAFLSTERSDHFAYL